MSTPASANRTTLKYSKETLWAETPVTPAMVEIGVTDQDFQETKAPVESQVIRADRQIDASVDVARSATGSLTTEVSTQVKPLLEGVFMNTFTEASHTDATLTDTVSIVNTAGVLTIVFDDAADYAIYAPSNIIRVTNSGTTNDGRYQVLTRNSGTRTLTVAALSGNTVVNENTTAVPALTLAVAYVRNGVLPISFLFERSFEELDKFQYFKGQRVNTTDISVNAQQILTIALSLMGKDASPYNDDTVAGSTTPAPLLDPISASANVGAIIKDDGTALTTALTAFTYNFNNNLRERPVVGSKYTLDHGLGQFQASGTLSAYFSTTELYEVFRLHTDVGLTVPFITNSGVVMCVSVPRVKINAAPAPVTGVNTDVMLDLTFNALRHPDLNYTAQIDVI